MIKNIIIDLGGVIINIDYNRTIDAFRQLNVANIEELYSQAKQSSLFDDFETGKKTAAEFREAFNLPISDEVFDKAWNAMLLDFPRERLDFIKELKTQFQLALFSNINEIHLVEVNRILKHEHGIDSLNDYFHKIYYSHLFQKRKPDVESFEALLKENNMRPEETLFLDDSPQHVEGARKAGVHAVLITKEVSLLDTHRLIKEINERQKPKLETSEILQYASSNLFFDTETPRKTELEAKSTDSPIYRQEETTTLK